MPLTWIMILLIIIILFKQFRLYEEFIVPKNSDKIDMTQMAPSKEVTKIEKTINEIYKNPIDESNLISYGASLNLIFTKQLHNFIIDKLKNQDLNYSNYIVDIAIPFKNIKYNFLKEKKIENDKEIIINLNEIILKFDTVMSVNNLYKFDKVLDFLVKRVSFIIKITSVNNFNLTNNNPITSFKNEYTSFLKYELLDIIIKEDVEIDSPFKAQDKLYENYFRITNVLNLLTPFTSSYDEMLITERMRLDYEKALPDIKDIQAPIYKPYLD
jgi:hypothetical protein